jgi:PAS domain S-box-containing protein
MPDYDTTAQLDEKLTQQSMLLHNISDYIYTHDLEGYFIEADFSKLNITGYKNSELIGKNIFNLLEIDQKDKLQDYITRIKKFGYDEGPVKIKTKNGSSKVFWYSNTMTTIAGSPVVNGLARDITTSIALKADLKKHKKKLDDILKTMVDGYFEVDLSGNFTFVNQAIADTMQYRRDELCKMNYKQCTTDENRHIVKKMFNEVYKTGRTGQVFEYEIICKNKSTLAIETTATIINDENGIPIGFRGIARDITEKKEAEKALKENEARLFQIVHGNSIPTFVIDSNHIVQHWNRACEKLTQISEKKIGNTPFHWKAFYNDKRPTLADLIVAKASQDEFNKFYPNQVKKSSTVDGAYSCEKFFPGLGKDGKWLFITAAPLKDINGKITGAIETIQDTTARKKAELFLKKEQEILEEKVKNRTQALKDTNTALKVLLKNREEDQKNIEEIIVSNLNETVLPFLEKLKNSTLKKNQAEYVDIMFENINDIISPLLKKMSLDFVKLTPAEIQVANLIKLGKSTKAIADILNLSPRTIEFHRDNLREKTGIKNQKINLRSYLLSLEQS